MQDNLQAGLQGHCPDHLEDSPSFGKDSPSFVGKLSASMQVFLRILVEACRDLFRAQTRPLCVRSFFVRCLERLLLWCPRRGCFSHSCFRTYCVKVFGKAFCKHAGSGSVSTQLRSWVWRFSWLPALRFSWLATGFLSGATTDLMERVDHVGEIAENAGVGHSWTKGIAFSAVVLVLNVLVFPLYGAINVLTYIFGAEMLRGGIHVSFFLSLNGWILGRTFFDLAARRSLPARVLSAQRREERIEIWMFGVLFVILAFIPPMTFVLPVFGLIVMVRFRRLWWARNSSAEQTE